MKIIGHRGAAGLAPENTVAGFELALDLGVDMIELDAHCCACGEVAVIHNKKLKGLSLLKGKVHHHPYDAIAASTSGQQRIPRLSEILALVGRRCEVNIEVKDPRAMAAAIKIVEHHGLTEAVIISSFHLGAIRQAKTINSGVRTALLASGTPMHWQWPVATMKRVTGIRHWHQMPAWGKTVFTTLIPLNRGLVERLLRYAHADGLHLDANFVTPGLTRNLQRHGFFIHAWVVNDTKKYSTMLRAGVDGIITDYPNLFCHRPHETHSSPLHASTLCPTPTSTS